MGEEATACQEARVACSYRCVNPAYEKVDASRRNRTSTLTFDMSVLECACTCVALNGG